ncbi:hypothetical protein BT67DRAFT_86959 [Trichocladium antarcticum]|uniref:Uncharacterized protein n=1 Tax=Trichocladium antarcticum TaxID=1450529 RepID=A0AAN6ZAY9_9PEZI|nr:hypothetical protein BT67DRAFT_86959 [Trichocladium antarcticum]
MRANATTLAPAVFVSPLYFQTSHTSVCQLFFCVSWAFYPRAVISAMRIGRSVSCHIRKITRLLHVVGSAVWEERGALSFLASASASASTSISSVLLLCSGQNSVSQPACRRPATVLSTYGQPQLVAVTMLKRPASGTGMVGRLEHGVDTSVGLSGLGSLAARDPPVTAQGIRSRGSALPDSIRIDLHTFFPVCLPFLLVRSF